MPKKRSSVNIYLSGLIWILGAACIVVLGVVLVHRFRPEHGVEGHNEAVGHVFVLVGGLQAVLVAFVLISLFDSVSTVREGSYTEANALVAIDWASDSLPEPSRTKIQQLTSSYTHSVINNEWPSMREAAQVNGAGWDQLSQLRAAIADAQVEEDWAVDRKIEAANQLWTVFQARQTRLDISGGTGVSTVVWFALVLGSLISVSLAYLFRGTGLLTHAVIVGTLAATITLLMFAIYQLQNPFSGGAHIDPIAFQSALDRLR
jgi:hypothetical protein